MAPNEPEFHESDEKFLAPGAATSSNTALQRGGLVSNRWAVAAAPGVSFENGPEWTRISRIRWEIPGPRGCYVFQHRAAARLARVEPVSRRRRCSRVMAHRVTVQPLT